MLVHESLEARECPGEPKCRKSSTFEILSGLTNLSKCPEQCKQNSYEYRVEDLGHFPLGGGSPLATARILEAAGTASPCSALRNAR